MKFSIALFAVVLIFYHIVLSQGANMCNTTASGSITTNGHTNLMIEFSRNTSYKNNTFIRFSTCSSETTFDTYLYLFNDIKTQIIDSCDDYCSSLAKPCMINEKIKPYTIWDLYLSSFTELRTNYIFQISGYRGDSGSYTLRISYDCNLNISINELIPITTSTLTTNPAVTQSTISWNASSIFDAASDETDDFEKKGTINLIVVIAALSAVFCGSICLCICCLKSNDNYLTNNPNVCRVLKIFSQVIISGLSIVSSLALSNSLGLSNHDNGLLAITMGSASIILVCWKYALNTASDYHLVEEAENAAAEDRFILGVVIMGATMTDATFDIFQGIAAITDEEYSSLSAFMLIAATWLGVGEEIMEGIFEIGTLMCLDCIEQLGDATCWALWMMAVVMFIGMMAELSMGIYIFSTFGMSVFKIVAIAIQSLSLLIAIIWACGVCIFEIKYRNMKF